MTEPYFDILLVVPLLEEFQSLQAQFGVKQEHIYGPLIAVELNLDAYGLKAVAVLQDEMGKSAASRAADILLTKYKVGIVSVIGIAGGLSNDVAVGDVCFSGTIIDVLDNAKVSDGPKGKAQIDFSSKFLSTDEMLSFAFKYVQIGQNMRATFEDWQLTQHYSGKELIKGEFIGRGSGNEVLGLPQIHEGNIVCGSVSKSEVYNSNLKIIDRKVLALETEAGGVFQIARTHKVPAIAIRGICDYADKNKNKLELQTDHKIRQVAANNAFTFLKLQLTNPQFKKFLQERRDSVLSNRAPLLVGLEGAREDERPLGKLRETIEEQLSQLSPHHVGKSGDYRLPLPRVKRSPKMATVNPAANRSDPVSILEAITSHRVLLIDVPRNYPDNSLPWVIAQELVLIDLNGKKTIAIVVDGDLIKPKQGTIENCIGSELQGYCSSEKFTPVFIITNFPPNSRARIQFLRQEIDKYPHGRFVIVNRVTPNIANEEDLVIVTGAEQVDVCEISFAEMSTFFQRTYQMEDQEAAVVALRLRVMFRKFNLNAHPSYFASVASEVITSLLKANRRTELLQIAVTGFLSFVVASDRASLVLSRTTREEFLRRLVLEKRVRGKKFNRQDLVQYVENFAGERDYDLDPFEFINSFQDKGLIHFDESGVEISLPFVESYLLASELASRPAEAAIYFDTGRKDFDFTTFDIYSEIGPSDEVVKHIVSALDAVIAGIPTTDDKHILLTDEIHPSVLDRGSRIRAIEQKLKRAFDDVVHARPNSIEKQQLLDVATRVEESAKSVQEQARITASNEQQSKWQILGKGLTVWGIAVIMLGSASERLHRDAKRDLTGKIVPVTAALLDQLMRAFSDVGLTKAKQEMQSEANLRQIFGLGDEVAIDPEQVEFIGAIVDAYEFSLMGYPIRALFEVLGNSAGQPVLSKSITNVTFKDKMHNLVARVWASEIDAAKERSALLRAITELPHVPFFRATLSNYFIARAFWNQWERSGRLALLDAAEKALEPFNQRFDKGRLKRMLDEDDEVEGE